ncbi:dual specificity protein phosphatase 3-like [Sycon ciliatum]|uniref:dual specificity protein phosphatase 3-like n=1 Tax=Sycon ciliatum TaxID=27933 RepID=UPI0020AA4A96|eukprot:scpid22148/ scgid33715/ Dual specificity protein phosphatase 3; Dual specificity protein phosphatase VHR; Vaccinia H1-related phosphatase; Dual specificity protein phosphatase 3; Vaccinia H1-related phosphatase
MATPADPPSVEELQDLMSSEGGFVMMPGRAYDEVHPGILIGEASIALNKVRLQSAGVTHVLNCAEGTSAFHVKTGAGFYGDIVKYYGIQATDSEGFSLRPFFDGCSDFIASALADNGKVLVHCREGVSRSTTVVLAFLMARRGMALRDAITGVRKHREVYPNEGFLRQLIEYEQELRQSSSGASAVGS